MIAVIRPGVITLLMTRMLFTPLGTAASWRVDHWRHRCRSPLHRRRPRTDGAAGIGLVTNGAGYLMNKASARSPTGSVLSPERTMTARRRSSASTPPPACPPAHQH